MNFYNNFLNKLKWKIRVIKNHYLTIWLRPVYAKDVMDKTYITTSKSIAIIIQGGILEKYDFTLETVRLYKNNYPTAKIILSTWDDADSNLVEKFKEEDIYIVLSSKPKPIKGNGNLQVISTIEGLKKAKSLGCEYACKTRTDQRMYATGIFPYLLKLQQYFPIKDNIDLQGRIITYSCNTFRNRLYDINDMWSFGHTDDLIKYWSCNPNFEWDEETANHIKEKQRLVENYVCINFLKSLGCRLKYTEEDSVNYYAKYFIIIDNQSLDIFYAKRLKEYFNKSYKENESVNFSFRDWMALQ